MGKGSSKAPPAPDPYVSANAQAQANIKAAEAQAALNRINEVTPWGTVTYTRTPLEAAAGTAGTTGAGGTAANTSAALLARLLGSSGGAGNLSGYMPDEQWTRTIELNPEDQKILDQQRQLSQALNLFANQQVGRVQDVLSRPFTFQGLPDQVTGVGTDGIQRTIDFSGLMGLPGIDDFSADRQRVEDALYQRATAALDPRFQQEQRALESQLANMGLAPGTEAYRQAIEDFNRSKNNAYQAALNDAILAGGNEQSRLFGLGLAGRQQGVNEILAQGQFANQAQQQLFNQLLTNANLQNQARQQGIQEQAYLRNLPLNEIAALLGNAPGVATPQFGATPQVGVGAPDVQGAMNTAYQGQLANWQAQQQARQANMGGLFGLAGSLGSAAILASDRRMKRDIVKVGELPNGLALYRFRYKAGGPEQVGVMADEVERVMPEAVAVDRGFKVVDYSKVFERRAA